MPPNLNPITKNIQNMTETRWQDMILQDILGLLLWPNTTASSGTGEGLLSLRSGVTQKRRRIAIAF